MKAVYNVKVWNRTRSKAEPLEKSGATLVNSPSDLSDVDVLATMVSTGKDVESSYILVKTGCSMVVVFRGYFLIFRQLASTSQRNSFSTF